MSAAAPYIPSTDAGIDSWANTFQGIVATDYASLGVSSGEATALTAAYVAYHAALALVIDPSTRTSVVIADKNTKRAALLATARPLAQRIAGDPSISDMDKTALGLNPHGTLPTPIAAPTSFPVLDVLSCIPGCVKFQYRDSDTPTSKAKPYGCVTMEMWYVLGTAPVMVPDDAQYYGPITKSPNMLTFDGGAGGKICTLFARWVNRNTLAGPWSSPVSVQITA